MMITVSARDVCKRYCAVSKRSLRYVLADLACETLGLKQPELRLRKDEFWALSHLDFQLHPGECVALMGGNGSGKSTLLKLLAGVMMPDIGRIELAGHAAGLIEVAAGFHPLLTGRENVYLLGAILGMRQKEIRARFDEIVAFSGVEQFLDMPVKHYSSGMNVRLGIAITVLSHVDILLVDEVLSVSDTLFRRQCIEALKQRANEGATIVLTSHHFEDINTLCQRAIVLHKGIKIHDGDIAQARRLLPTTELSQDKKKP